MHREETITPAKPINMENQISVTDVKTTPIGPYGHIGCKSKSCSTNSQQQDSTPHPKKKTNSIPPAHNTI